MQPNAAVEYVDADTNQVLGIIPFYDPGCDPKSAEFRARGAREFPFMAYGCGGPWVETKKPPIAERPPDAPTRIPRRIRDNSTSLPPRSRGQRYTITPCVQSHLIELAKTMRAADRAEIEAAGRVPLLLLRSLWRRSVDPKTAIVDGEVAAIWGDEAGLLADEGNPWLFTSPAVERLPLAFFREARAEIEAMLVHRSSLRSRVDARYAASLRFFQLLGFSVGGPVVIGKTTYQHIWIKRRSDKQPVAERPPFIVYALPRSRTAWLSAFLSYGDWSCLHEEATNIDSLKEMRKLLARPRTGSAETAAAPAWELLRRYSPQHRAVVVLRPVEDTVAAMIEAGRKVGVAYDEPRLRKVMEYGNRCLQKIAAVPGTLTVKYDDLADEETCRRIFEFCLPYEFDLDWWVSLKDQNVQVDLAAYFANYRARRNRVEDFKRECKLDLIRLVRGGGLQAHAID